MGADLPPIVRGSKLTRHSRISFIKSAIRFVGYGTMLLVALKEPSPASSLEWVKAVIFIAGVFLGLAEIVGIVEEFDQTYGS